MESVLTIILLGGMAGVLMSRLRPARQPAISCVLEEPQQRGRLPCATGLRRRPGAHPGPFRSHVSPVS